MNSESNPHGEEALEARYANCLKVGHNAFEFVLVFGQLYADRHDMLSHTRIVTGPQYAKVFLEILSGSIDQYEKVHGPIQKK